jgi:heptose I phosphotransferase
MKNSFFIAEDFAEALAGMGVRSMDDVFSLEQGRDLAKKSIGRYRRRIELEVTLRSGQSTKLYLKRYDHPPLLKQLSNWFACRRRVSFGGVEHDAAFALCAAGIGTPHIAAWGCQWGSLFEQRSFLVTHQVADSDSLERRLPACFSDSGGLQDRRRFIRSLAQFIRRFHLTGFRHRDLYLAHIFCSTSGQFCLIDLARAFRPLLTRRFQVKDLAQLHYSAPAGAFTRTDRLRFYLTYCDHRRLNESDKLLIRAVTKKANRMASHNRKHGIPIPFLEPAGAKR